MCTGGILGLGKRPEDHVGLIYAVATMPSHPESFLAKTLLPIKGTPIGDSAPIAFDGVARTIATTHLAPPASIICLTARGISMSEEKQMMCFMAGANTILTEEKTLMAKYSGWDQDKAMFDRWVLKPMKSWDEILKVRHWA